MHIDIHVTGQKTGKKQEAHRKAHTAKKTQGEILKGAGEKPLLLRSFERVGSFLQDLSDGLGVVLPFSLAADPDSQYCFSLAEISSVITEPAGLWQQSKPSLLTS